MTQDFSDIFNTIFGSQNPFNVDKEQAKKQAIDNYIKGRISKEQLDERMKDL